MQLSPLDILVFVIYVLAIVSVGLWVSRRKKGEKEDSKDYFFAGRMIPWWALGASLIASNISAEQFIGMSGSGYAMGLGIAAYEWMAAITLLVVARYFLPIFIKEGIFTMPQFLERRYDKRVKTSLAVFWLLVYVFVNLTSVFYLGSLALKPLLGDSWGLGIALLALFAGLYSVYGGLKAVAWTDVVQVTFLIIGGLITTFIALDAVSGGNGPIAGFSELIAKAPEKFDLVFGPESEFYSLLPGISVLVGGMWIANLSYWGCNQYIIQIAFAGKSLREAQKGLAFAAYLKLFLPLIVVIPGIAAFLLEADIAKPDEAYPYMLNNFVPIGLKGLSFAALIAAVVSSLAVMANSISTIFTLDIYQSVFKPEASEKELVTTGRIAGGTALLIGALIAPLLASLDQAFQFIQSFTGMISPGVVVIFLFGLFWKRASANAALVVAMLSIPLSFALEQLFPALPFLHRMEIVFGLLCILMIVISLSKNKGEDPNAIQPDKGLFHTPFGFNMAALGVMGILVALYALFW